MPVVRLDLCKDKPPKNTDGTTAANQPNAVVDVVFEQGRLMKVYADGKREPVEGFRIGAGGASSVATLKNGSGNKALTDVLTPVK